MKSLSIVGALILSATAAAQLHAQTPAAENSYMSAAIIVREFRAMGFTASTNADESGDPRVNASIDGHAWQIYFYDCGAGVLEQRQCQSFQFFADNTMPNPVSLQTVNKWNKEISHAKAYLQQKNEAGCPSQDSCAARIELDVLMMDTNADSAQTFRAYFNIFRQRAVEFRRFIGAK